MKVTKHFKVLIALIALTGNSYAMTGDYLAKSCANNWGSAECKRDVAEVCKYNILTVCGDMDACEDVPDTVYAMCEAFGLDEEQAIYKALIK